MLCCNGNSKIEYNFTQEVYKLCLIAWDVKKTSEIFHSGQKSQTQ